MEQKLQIWTIFEKDVGEGVFERLEKIFPEGVRMASAGHTRTFDCSVVADSEPAQDILCVLERSGMKAKTGGRTKKGKEFRYEIKREYEPADWEVCEVLDPRPTEW